LKYRTYVDDAVAGAGTLERLQELSIELETVTERGGFQFKESRMSRGKVTDPSEPRTVLGLVWETQQDQLQLDIKLNTGGKRGGAQSRKM
jgi:hypothetical protein